jgi:hypothetical protein
MSVTQAEIIAFRTSITARRFPALREMRDEDLAALVLANKKVSVPFSCVRGRWGETQTLPYGYVSVGRAWWPNPPGVGRRPGSICAGKSPFALCVCGR